MPSTWNWIANNVSNENFVNYRKKTTQQTKAEKEENQAKWISVSQALCSIAIQPDCYGFSECVFFWYFEWQTKGNDEFFPYCFLPEKLI